MSRLRRTVTSHGPHEVDLRVGAAIRLRRIFLDMNQRDLATKIGISFQQLHKYEKGVNRISASKLYEIAGALATPVGWFFQGLEMEKSLAFKTLRAKNAVAGLLNIQEGAELAEFFPAIRAPALRLRILELVKTMAELE